MTEYLAHKILEAIAKNQALVYTEVYISLHSGDPGENGSHEISGGSYARIKMEPADWEEPTSKATENSAYLLWENMPSCTVRYIGIWDDDSNFLDSYAYTKRVPLGENFRINAGDLQIIME